MAENANPYEATSLGQAALVDGAGTLAKLLSAVAWTMVVYYAISSMTLPWADDWWLGELPVLALVQLPKSWFQDWVQGIIMAGMRIAGMSSGSPSPDMIASAPWAFAVLFVTPTGVLVGAAAVFRRLVACRWALIALFITAAIDAGVTMWFEATSRLSLF